MKIKWFGTAALQFINGDDSILFDPFLARNSSLPSASVEQFAAMGDIFITHGHFDHLIDLPLILKAGKSSVYCSPEAADSLTREGTDQSRIIRIAPGDRIVKGSIEVVALKGAHIKFNLPLIIRTLFSRRTLKNLSALRTLLQAAKLYPEGRVLAYQINVGSKKVLHLGSLNLDRSETYPQDVNLLTLPFQGRSDLNSYTLRFIEQIKPRALYLHHFDDSFPPVSSTVETGTFVSIIANRYRNMPVIIPEFEREITI